MSTPSPIGIAEVAARLRLPIRWIKSEAIAGRLPHLRVGRRWLFDEAAVRTALGVRAAAVRGEPLNQADTPTTNSSVDRVNRSAPPTPSEIVQDPAVTALIRSQARRWVPKPWHRGGDADDLVQDLAMLVFRKGHLFDPKRGCVGAFVSTVLRSHDLMARKKFFAKKRRANGGVISLDGGTGDEAAPLADALTQEDGDRRIGRCDVSAAGWMVQCENRELLESLASADEMAVLLDLHDHGPVEAGRRHGLSRHQVDRLFKKICLRVRKARAVRARSA